MPDNSRSERGKPRRARPSDLRAITELLAKVELPTSGVAEHLDAFVVVEAGASLVAVGGLELYPPLALLRSIAVAPAHQGSGVGSAICDALEAAASRFGVEQLYLLTLTAESFFARRGYAVVSRETAPAAIASTAEFAALCPQTAVLMRRAVGGIHRGSLR